MLRDVDDLEKLLRDLFRSLVQPPHWFHHRGKQPLSSAGLFLARSQSLRRRASGTIHDMAPEVLLHTDAQTEVHRRDDLGGPS